MFMVYHKLLSNRRLPAVYLASTARKAFR